MTQVRVSFSSMCGTLWHMPWSPYLSTCGTLWHMSCSTVNLMRRTLCHTSCSASPLMCRTLWHMSWCLLFSCVEFYGTCPVPIPFLGAAPYGTWPGPFHSHVPNIMAHIMFQLYFQVPHLMAHVRIPFPSHTTKFMAEHVVIFQGLETLGASPITLPSYVVTPPNTSLLCSHPNQHFLLCRHPTQHFPLFIPSTKQPCQM